MNTPRSRILYTALSLALAGLLLYWSVRGIQWTRVWQSLLTARPYPLAVCCLIVSGALFLRAFRWRVLLSAEGPIGLGDAFWATSAGYLGNQFLPARAGELIRTVMISKRTNLSKTYVLTTALGERMADAVALVIISSSVLLFLPEKPGWLAHAAEPFAVVGFAAVIAVAVLPLIGPFLERILRGPFVPTRLRSRLLHLLEQVLLGIRSFHDARRLFLFICFTILIWSCDSITTVIAARAVGLDIPLPLACLLITGLGLGSALPSTPGYVGVYQFVAVSVLMPFGFQRDDAIAYILLFQAIQYVVTTFWGLLALWQSRRTAEPLEYAAP